MPERTIRIKANDGSTISFVQTDNAPSGAMKYVYFSPKRDYVVAFFHDKNQPNAAQRARLESLVGKYRNDIFTQEGGDYWGSLFCWPDRLVEWEGKLGLVMPTYPSDFFFSSDPKLKGSEKQGKWFASAKLLRGIAPSERGNFHNHLKICLKLAQAIRRLHAAGLAHSDLSYKNVLIDPSTGKACVIDIDGLVVPGKFPPDVLGTPDFIAPEVIATQNRPAGHRELPKRTTDLHALAVLIYMYLLHRHPLRGGRYFGDDADDEETLMMGTHPLYIEHPTDHANRNLKREYGDDYSSCLPWVDLNRLPARNICGPYLCELFDHAFIDGLKDPQKRPSAMEWEIALVKTSDLVLPCVNPKCSQRYFIYNNTCPAVCPFCGTRYTTDVPILDFYSPTGTGSFKQDGSRMAVGDGTSLCKWHTEKGFFPNEKLPKSDYKRLGYFRFHRGAWHLVNERATGLYEIPAPGQRNEIRAGSSTVLNDGKKLLLSDSPNGRVAVVSIAHA